MTVSERAPVIPETKEELEHPAALVRSAMHFDLSD
jgi:hypothetical protein